LHHLLHLDFDPADHPPYTEILAAWPQVLEDEVALFRSLERTLLDALEEADDIGFLQGWDRPSYDVPSVAHHPQNAHHRGFCPITRTLAELWLRIASRDVERARKLVQPWAAVPYLLVRRFHLFAHAHTAFSPVEAAKAVRALDDETFWLGEAQVEIMRILTGRWADLPHDDRAAIETRLRGGKPRDLYRADAFENEGEWQSVWDSAVYRRLKRIEETGGGLSRESTVLLAEIAARNPKWQPSSGDRDDFHSWHEMRSGPSGHPELLAGIADEALVTEAMRIQRERRFEEGDIWRVFCDADPDRALRGLGTEAGNGRWDAEAWRYLIWAANDKGDAEFQFALADLLLAMPDAPLVELLPAATSWLQRKHDVLAGATQPGGSRFLPLWDRFASLAFPAGEEGGINTKDATDDLVTESLNSPGGVLAWALLDALSSPGPEADSLLGSDFTPRFDKAVAAGGRAGLLARVYLIRFIAYFDAIDPTWTEQQLTPRLSWDHPEALALWRSYAHGEIGSSRLFNALKPAMLAAFERKQLADDEFEGIISKLLSVCIWHQRGESPEYDLTGAELKRALTVGPPAARRNTSWNFWRMMADPERTPADKAARWREIVGPLFRDIWPLDADLRSKGTTRNFVNMALESGEAFPEAVDAILDFLIPYELYQIAHSLRLDDKHDHLVKDYPRAFLRLANALIDPAAFVLSVDLGVVLEF
jgi:hypothetical protein